MDDYYLRRAGLDYWQYLECEVVDDWQALVSKLPERRPWFFTKTAQRSYSSVAYEPQDVLVFGDESQGLPANLLAQEPERALRIPLRAEARSLNLSNAVAVAVFEALRQGVGPADYQ